MDLIFILLIVAIFVAISLLAVGVSVRKKNVSIESFSLREMVKNKKKK